MNSNFENESDKYSNFIKSENLKIIKLQNFYTSIYTLPIKQSTCLIEEVMLPKGTLYLIITKITFSSLAFNTNLTFSI